jgi:hypothetical protein
MKPRLTLDSGVCLRLSRRDAFFETEGKGAVNSGSGLLAVRIGEDTGGAVTGINANEL